MTYVVTHVYDDGQLTVYACKKPAPELMEIFENGGFLETETCDIYVDAFKKHKDAIEFMDEANFA